MGALGGHIPHLWEARELSVADVLNALENLVLDRCGVEKVDGINVWLKFDGSVVLCARSRADIESGGFDASAVFKRFTDESITAAVNRAISSFRDRCRDGLYPRNEWLSADVIDPMARNVISYGRASRVVVHSTELWRSPDERQAAIASSPARDRFENLVKCWEKLHAHRAMPLVKDLWRDAIERRLQRALNLKLTSATLDGLSCDERSKDFEDAVAALPRGSKTKTRALITPSSIADEEPLKMLEQGIREVSSVAFASAVSSYRDGDNEPSVSSLYSSACESLAASGDSNVLLKAHGEIAHVEYAASLMASEPRIEGVVGRAGSARRLVKVTGSFAHINRLVWMARRLKRDST